MKGKLEEVERRIATLKEDLGKLTVMTDSRRKIIEELEAKNSKLKDENSHLNKCILDLENQKELLRINHEKSKSTTLFVEPDLSNFILYDIIVHIDSFHQIEWHIEYKLSEEQRKLYCSTEKSQIPSQIVVGVMGRENVGKTYIMSKLSGLNLPTGHNLQTKGLSIKYSTKQNIITTCLDSAGVHAPVYYFDEKVYRRYMKNEKKFEELAAMEKESKRLEMINDKKLTETFIEDFILNSANVVLIVVGQLTQDDQTIIERVRREYQFKKRIMVIHNFPFLSTEEAIKDRVSQDIEKAFDVDERILPGTNLRYYCEKLENKDNNPREPIVHFVYAREGSEAGKKFNVATLNFVWDKITSINDRESFEIVEYIQNFFQKTYKKYFKININGEEERNSQHQIKLFEEKNVIRLEKDSTVDLIPQNPTFTALGSMLINNLSDFDPNYELIEYEPNKLICKMEIPNLDSESLEILIDTDNQFHLLKVKGVKAETLIKEKGKEEKGMQTNKMKIHSGDIKWGRFEKWVQLGNLIDVIEFDPDNEVTYENGVFTVKFIRLGSKNK